MKKKIMALLITTALGISTLASNSFATNVTNQANKEFQKREDFKKPENEIFGKITAISENSVTISLAEMKKLENTGNKEFGNRPEKPNNTNENGNNENGKQPPERKELTDEQKAEMKKRMEEMFTLTGETKTIDISNAKFDDFGRGPRDGKKDTTTNNNENANKVEKTYKDYQVGDYIAIELENETSNKAKFVRSAGMMRGGPRKQRNDGQVRKDRQERKTNDAKQ